jgi:ABC-type Zn uptake system ZnuABC Zn-binding protein ZnuA
MSFRLEDNDKGLKRIRKRIKAIENRNFVVDSGLFGYQARIGVIHEYGAPEANIPQRSFIRSTIDENRNEYISLLEKFSEKILEGKITIKQVLNILALKLASDIKKKITKIRRPKNAKATIKRKGVNNPLIHFGYMRNAVESIVRKA